MGFAGGGLRHALIMVRALSGSRVVAGEWQRTTVATLTPVHFIH